MFVFSIFIFVLILGMFQSNQENFGIPHPDYIWGLRNEESKRRDDYKDDDDKDDDDESFLDTAPKHFMSLIWFTYMVSIHVGIAANPGNKGFKNPFSVSPVGGGKRGGKKGGSSGYQVQLGPMTDVAKHLIVMGIIMALINSFSYLWLYGRCKSEVNDSNMLKQIHGAQINIIVIGVVAIAIYILRTAKGGE